VNWTAYNALNGQVGSGSASMSGPSTGGVWLVTFNVSIPLSGRLEWGVTALDTVGNSTNQGGGPRVNAVAACS
jgi:hypothetical protein